MLTDAQVKELNSLATCYDESARVFGKEDSWFMSFLGVLLLIVSFGQMRSFKTFATTLFNRIYFPSNWTFEQCKRVLPHECRHVHQFKRGLYVPFALAYLLFPLPMVLAYVRFWAELDADRFAWRIWLAERGQAAEYDISRAAASRPLSVCSSSYLWPWPRAWGVKAYGKAAALVLSERRAA